MGCDIHSRAEVFGVRQWLDGAWIEEPIWRCVEKPIFSYDYFREDEQLDPFNDHNFPWTVEPYGIRNYWLFSVLADVRNSRSTHNIFDPSMKHQERDSLAPIAMPRGVPADASEGWLKEVEEWGADLHSTSYFTLTELKHAVAAGAFDQGFICRGYISKEAFMLLENAGTTPTEWAGYASNGIQREEWDAMTVDQQRDFTGWIAAEWLERAELKDFVERTIPELERLAPVLGTWTWEDRRADKPDPRTRDTDKVRFVFGFDN